MINSYFIFKKSKTVLFFKIKLKTLIIINKKKYKYLNIYIITNGIKSYRRLSRIVFKIT